jgi:hypothetical protein
MKMAAIWFRGITSLILESEPRVLSFFFTFGCHMTDALFARYIACIWPVS